MRHSNPPVIDTFRQLDFELTHEWLTRDSCHPCDEITKWELLERMWDDAVGLIHAPWLGLLSSATGAGLGITAGLKIDTTKPLYHHSTYPSLTST